MDRVHHLDRGIFGWYQVRGTAARSVPCLLRPTLAAQAAGSPCSLQLRGT